MDEEKLKLMLSKILDRDVREIERTTFVKLLEELVGIIEKNKTLVIKEMKVEDREKFIKNWVRISNTHYSNVVLSGEEHA